MRLLKTVLILCISCFSAFSFASSPTEAISMVDAKSENIFVFKGNRKLIGATVEVFYADGTLLTKQILRKRRMIIDFCEVRSGDYTILISKGDKKKEYQYTKRL